MALSLRRSSSDPLSSETTQPATPIPLQLRVDVAPPWIGWVLRPTPAGWRHVRVSIPVADLERYAVGEIAAPNTRAITVARIERELVSDRLVDRRGWSEASMPVPSCGGCVHVRGGPERGTMCAHPDLDAPRETGGTYTSDAPTWCALRDA